ncbi:unnamed protein product, partial [Mesorhabditis spiculigera]
MKLAALFLLVVLCFGTVEATQKICGNKLTAWIKELCGRTGQQDKGAVVRLCCGEGCDREHVISSLCPEMGK